MTDSKVSGHKSVDSKLTAAKTANYHVSLRAQVTSADSGGALGRLSMSPLVQRLRRLSGHRSRAWDRRSPAGLEKVTAAVLAAVSIEPGDQVLDIGCGT